MGHRYRFIDLGTISTEVELLDAIALPASSMQRFALYGQSHSPMKHVLETLKAIGTKTLLIQDSVRDPDFLAEHQAFYGKQHRTVPRLCMRVHAFDQATPVFAAKEATPIETLDFLDKLVKSEAQYLGFVTIRPLRHAPVGASILKAPNSSEVTCHERFPVHIAGKEFEVVGTPYLQQDNAVGACAQASIWIALRTQMKRVGNTAFTPAELTLAATRYLATDRVFPGRQGLVIQQMLEAIRSSGHDPLTLECNGGAIGAPPAASQVIEDALPYLESGLPVIATLFPDGGGHAVVCIGRKFSSTRVVTSLHKSNPLNITYSLASDWVSQLVVHNDNTGPYVALKSGNPKGNDYCLENTRNLVIPLPDTVFLTAKEAETIALKSLAYITFFASNYDTSKKPRLTPEADIVLRTCLVQRHAFRKWALEDGDMDADLKTAYRTFELPRLLWVVEIHDAKIFNPVNPEHRSRIGEIVVDASADSLHGDATLCAHITKHVLPSYLGFEALLLQDGEGTDETLVVLKTGNPGKLLASPWC